MGQIILPLNEIFKMHLDVPKWWSLNGRNIDEVVCGSFLIKFSINTNQSKSLRMSLKNKKENKVDKPETKVVTIKESKKSVQIADTPPEEIKPKMEKRASATMNPNSKVVTKSISTRGDVLRSPSRTNPIANPTVQPIEKKRSNSFLSIKKDTKSNNLM
eukprot:TRINITY_DN3231_c0_g1_i2.p1 TRINITY_DN3231_c0_g1~~TRINITY_DN3231_c0_g1_i2.p1  ORF type:complete len:159 (-),score=22.37 TRINITY_DN3231_c0_g1_i2:28-504(-)